MALLNLGTWPMLVRLFNKARFSNAVEGLVRAGIPPIEPLASLGAAVRLFSTFIGTSRVYLLTLAAIDGGDVARSVIYVATRVLSRWGCSALAVLV